MRNYCADCGELLIDTVERRYGFCVLCLSIKFEKLDSAIADLWYETEE